MITRMAEFNEADVCQSPCLERNNKIATWLRDLSRKIHRERCKDDGYRRNSSGQRCGTKGISSDRDTLPDSPVKASLRAKNGTLTRGEGGSLEEVVERIMDVGLERRASRIDGPAIDVCGL